MTEEREKEIRAKDWENPCQDCRDLLAEIDRLRAEKSAMKTVIEGVHAEANAAIKDLASKLAKARAALERIAYPPHYTSLDSAVMQARQALKETE